MRNIGVVKDNRTIKGIGFNGKLFRYFFFLGKTPQTG